VATVSTAMCGDVLELRRECSNFLVRVSRVPPCGARWVELETLAGPMGVPWADGPPHQLPAAVRAHVHEDSVGTVGAPRALVRADSSVVGLRREVAITELAVRAYFQGRHHLSFCGRVGARRYPRPSSAGIRTRSYGSERSESMVRK
jgi:hypothetical protein